MKSGRLRMVIDYRQLNERAIKDRFPTPLVQSHLDFLAGNKWQSSVDLVGAHVQPAARRGKGVCALRGSVTDAKYTAFEPPILVITLGLVSATVMTR